jgi:16S rRNA (cytosine967-C5)-methyltransferase
MHVANVKAIVADSRDFDDPEKFDRVLIDAPCSGIGTLRKKPDIKWKRDLGDIRKLSVTQLELLENGAKQLKVGGELVYSTCTIEPEENFEIVSEFLKKNPDFVLVPATEMFKDVCDPNGCVQTYTNVHQIDGSFAAKVRKVR